MSTAACNGHSGCLAWEQFVYSSSETSAFMQYGLIDYGNSCPSGWNSYDGSCYKNSAAVSVPKEPITSLASLKLSGTAVNGGNDTLVFTAGTKAYSTTGKDSGARQGLTGAAGRGRGRGDDRRDPGSRRDQDAVSRSASWANEAS